jgi:hypothetical protein
MEQQKYFIPEIGDIRVGYECEKEDSIKGYEPYTFDLKGVRDVMQDEISDYRETWFRTPYLSKEQIEAEGWKETELSKKVAGDYKRKAFIKNNYFLIWDTFRDSYIEITLIDPSKDYRFMNPENFKCTVPCKDINELRYICKLLEI